MTKHWCETHQTLETMSRALDFAYCDWCGHVWQSGIAWRSSVDDVKATGMLIDYDSDICPYCYVKAVVRR